MTQKVFKKGKPIQTLTSLAFEVDTGYWVYLRDIPKHPSIILNMTFKTVIGFLAKDMFYYATRRNPNGPL